MFLQYLTELDEALDIQSLTLPVGSPLEFRFRTKLADQRMLIREFLHLSHDIKTGRAWKNTLEGGQ